MPDTSRVDPAIVVGANIRAELARANRSQAWLGEKLGLLQSSVSERLRGKKAVDVNELCRIADLLSVPLSRLLSGVGTLEAAS